MNLGGLPGQRVGMTSPSYAHRAGQLQLQKAPLKNWRDRNRCATRIQVAYSTWQACRAHMSARHRARGAARSIQRWWQMLRSKHRLQVIMARMWWGFAWEMLQMDSASRRLQGGFRMMQLCRWRRRAVAEGAAVRRLQTWWRGHTVRAAVRTLSLAAVKVQRWHRKRSRWQSLLLFLGALVGEVRRKRDAATKVQRLWRGFVVRRQYSKQIERFRRALSLTSRKAAARKAPIEGRRRGLYQPMGSHRFGGPVAYRAALGDEAPTLSRPRLGTRLADPGRFGARPTTTPEHCRFGGPPSSAVASGASPRGISPGALPLPVAIARSRGLIPPVLSNTSPPLSSGGHHSSTVPASGRGQSPRERESVSPFDADRLFTDLMGRHLLSVTPQAPPWPHEPSCRSDIEAVRIWLGDALPSFEVKTVLRVECTLASAAYEGVRKTLGPERLLWHGTSWESVGNIVRHGFNRAYGGRHGLKLGRGSYFAEDAAYAMRFCNRHSQTKVIFLAGVLPGRCCKGEENLVEPPAADSSGARFDSTVDDTERPKVFCVFRDFQALPLYVAEVDRIKKEGDGER